MYVHSLVLLLFFYSSVFAQNDFIFFYCTSTGWRFCKAMKIAHKHSEKVIDSHCCVSNVALIRSLRNEEQH